jgi:hypothetical protein
MILPEEPTRQLVTSEEFGEVYELLNTCVPGAAYRGVVKFLEDFGVQGGVVRILSRYDGLLRKNRTNLLKERVPQNLNWYIGKYIEPNSERGLPGERFLKV